MASLREMNLRGGRMMGQNLQHLNAFLLAMLADLVAQHIFIAGLMRPLIELEARRRAAAAQCSSR